MRVWELDPGTLYYVAIKTSDEAGNESALSSVANVTTSAIGECSDFPEAMQGMVQYSVFGRTNPHVTGVTLGPLDVQGGETLAITVTARDTEGNPITEVTATFVTDYEYTPVTLTLTGGTEVNGTWEGSWTPSTDVHTCFYGNPITAVSSSGESVVTLVFR